MVGSDRHCTHIIILGIFRGLCYHLLGFTGNLVRLEVDSHRFWAPVGIGWLWLWLCFTSLCLIYSHLLNHNIAKVLDLRSFSRLLFTILDLRLVSERSKSHSWQRFGLDRWVE